MEACRMKDQRIQASGYYDVLTKEYAFTVCGGGLVVTFDFLSEEDINEMISCLTCMIPVPKEDK